MGARCSWFWPTPEEMLGWKRRRTAVGRLVVSDTDVKRIATLMNKLVDLDGYTEEEEQLLFEHSVTVCIEQIAPTITIPMWEMLHASRAARNLENSRDTFRDSIKKCCMDNIFLTFLDEQDKRRVIRCISFILAESMVRAQTLSEYTACFNDPQELENIVVKVFISGAMDVFFDDDVRGQLENDITEMIPEIPFIPFPFVLRMVQKGMEVLKGVLDESLPQSYHEFTDAQKKGIELPNVPPGMAKDKKRLKEIADTYKDKPFTLHLRCVLIENMIKCDKKYAGINLVRHAWRSRAYGWIVDIVFGFIPGLEKMEDSIIKLDPKMNVGKDKLN